MIITITKENPENIPCIDIWKYDKDIPIPYLDRDITYLLHPRCASEEIAMANRILQELYRKEISNSEIILSEVYVSNTADAICSELVSKYNNFVRILTRKREKIALNSYKKIKGILKK